MVYDSIARGNSTSVSDVDVAVKFCTQVTYDEIGDIVLGLASLLKT